MDTRMSRTNRVLAAVAASAALLALAAFAPSDTRVRADDPIADAMKSLAESRASALVPVKYVLKGGGGQFEEDMEMEAPGVVIEKTGLVLVANTYLGGFMSRFGGGASVTPTDIKVLVGDDTQGVEAKMIAKDGELDLAWIQINEPAAEGYPFVSFDHAATPEIGDSIFGVRRMGKFFDRATLVSVSRVSGTTKKPRKLYLDTTGNAVSMGHPVYDTHGIVIGVGTMVLPEQDEMEGLGRMFSAREDFGTGMILSADEVVKATARAKEMAALGKSSEDAAPAPAEPKPEGAGEMEP